MICPDCGYENIPGADHCDACGQPLAPLSTPDPGTDIERRLIEEPLKDVGVGDPLLVAPQTPVGEVLQKLVDAKVGCALVADGDVLLGIFTERDALRRLNTRANELSQEPVSKFMTEYPQVLDVSDNIVYAVHAMNQGGYRHIPLLSDQKIDGIVSVRDILSYMTQCLPG